MYKIIIVPVVPYGCKTRSLTLMKKHILRLFEYRVLRRMFGSKRDEVIGEWRNLHNEELHNLYSSPNTRMTNSRWMRWEGHVARVGIRVMYEEYWWESQTERTTSKTRTYVGE
jgi:hypothetical protein